MPHNRKQKIESVSSFVDELYARGLVKDITNRKMLEVALASNKVTYFGIDPTAPFLHIGHYLGLSLAKRFARNGYPVIILLGEFTAQIGDPSFRSNTRVFDSDIKENTGKVHLFLEKYFRREIKEGTIRVMNNYDLHNKYLSTSVFNWQETPLNILMEFISGVCGYVKVSNLFSKEFLRTRLGHGLSIAELLYPLVQGWDFLRLYLEHDVFIQMGGSDQWGNITTGLEIINKHELAQETQNKDEKDLSIVGFTFPVIEDESGKKIGKSDGNSIPITDHDSNTDYMLYQFLVNLRDEEALKTFYKLSFVDKEEIDRLWNDDVRYAKKYLSNLICDDIFEISRKRENIAAVVRITNRRDLMLPEPKFDYEMLKKLYITLPSIHLVWKEGQLLKPLFKQIDLVTSYSEFRRLCLSDGIYVNGNTVRDEKYIITEDDVSWSSKDGKRDGYLFIRKGKKQAGIVYFTVIE